MERNAKNEAYVIFTWLYIGFTWMGDFAAFVDVCFTFVVDGAGSGAV